MARRQEDPPVNNWSTIDVTPGRQEFWSSRDIDPQGAGHKLRGELAEYNYYAGLLSGGLDPDLLGSFSETLPSDSQEERFAKADSFSKSTPGFYVPEENFKDYIGEENVERFKELTRKAEAHYNLNTEGTKEKGHAYGARQFAMSAPRTFYKKSPIGERSYEYKYNPDKGAYHEMTKLELDESNPGFGAMERFNESFEVPEESTPELANGLDASGNDPLAQYQDSITAQNVANTQAINTKPTLEKVPEISEGEAGTKEGSEAVQGVLSKAGPWGAAISKVSGIGHSIGESVGGKEGSMIKGAFRPETIALNKDLSASERVFGTIVPGLGGIYAHKAEKEREREIQKENYRRRATEKIQPAQNTQASMYEFGTSGADATKPVEVEKDEVVMRKDSLGNYKLAADFKGGRRHDQGGEDYILQEGDIVFPGKKRSAVMKHLKAGNNAALESERLKLPKDLPKSDNSPELEKGIDSDGKSVDFTKEQESLNKYANDEIDKIYSDLEEGKITEKEAETQYKKIQDQFSKTVQGYAELSDNFEDTRTPLGPLTEDQWMKDTSFSSLWEKDKSSDEPIKELQPKTPQEKGVNPKPAVSGVPTKAEDFDMNIEPWMTDMDIFETQKLQTAKPSMSQPVTNALKPIEGYNMDLGKESPNSNPNKEAQDEAKVKTMIKGGSSISDILDFAPAAMNIIKGMQTPERVDRRFVTPDEVQYRDQSAQQRAEVDAAERIEMENAARYSGGSAQAARAGKAAATGRRFRRKGAIDAQEMQRADTIAAQNVSTRNRAEAQNIDLINQYETMDAQNKAAVDAYFDQGMHDVGRIFNQKTRDAQMERQQDILLENLRTDKFGANSSGKVSFLPGNDILPK